jgi:hypothetical protein
MKKAYLILEKYTIIFGALYLSAHILHHIFNH